MVGHPAARPETVVVPETEIMLGNGSSIA